MAETLTYDPGTDSTTLTTDEQESLEVGEKLVTEQEGLLAGKYKNAEELEQGYLELQKKFGTEETETKEKVTQTEEPVEEVSSQVTLINDACICCCCACCISCCNCCSVLTKFNTSIP